MAKAQRKPTLEAASEAATPQFHVLPDPTKSGAGANPFGDDPLSALGAAPAKKGGKTYPRATLDDLQRRTSVV